MNPKVKIWIVTGLFVFLIIGGAVSFVRMNTQSVSSSQFAAATKPETPRAPVRPVSGDFSVSIPALTADGRLPLEYTCFRAHVSPPVEWRGAPRGTKSLAVFMERRISGETPYVTWALFNIPADRNGLPRDLPKTPELEDGMRHARADSGAAEYSGPCQPEGKIPYVLRVAALDVMIGLPAGVPVAGLADAMKGHVLGKTEMPFIHFLRP